MKDWMKKFLNSCCDINPSYSEKSGELYKAYQRFCYTTGRRIVSTTEFYSELQKQGFIRHRHNYGVMVSRLRLKELEDIDHDEK